MRESLTTLVDDFRRAGPEIAVVRYQGVRRRATSYEQIARMAGRFAALLELHGAGMGDRILLWSENSAEWIAAFLGCMLRGALVVPLDAFGGIEFAAHVAADVRPRLAVGDGLLLRGLASRAGLEFPRLAFEDWPSILPDREAGPVSGIGRDTPLQILFTSGTTGEPRGIVHTHGNVLASIGPIEQAAQAYLRYEKYVHPLRFLHTLPLSHVFGQTMGLWIPPTFRAEVHFESRLVAPHLVEAIRRERVSVLAAVPRVFALVKAHLESSIPNMPARVAASKAAPAGRFGWRRWWRFRDVHRSFGLKFWALISGGGALAPAVEQFWNALGFVVVQGYGMTETTALITLNHPFHVASGTIGKPLPGREVKIGPDGEVLVRGPMISSVTWSGGEMHSRHDEWLATGDLARKQSTGELRFLGRKSEVIVTAAGVNIHPEDLEAAVEEQPGVAACAVVSMQAASGPEPCAVLALRGPEAQAPAAIERANARLADFQHIRRWVLYPGPDLPRTSTGKVSRKSVEAWLAGIRAASSGALPQFGAFSPETDWLLVLISQMTGEKPRGVGDELLLDEDLHLDSLGRVQLAAAIEQKLGMPPESGLLESMRTLGDLRAMAAGGAQQPSSSQSAITALADRLATGGWGIAIGADTPEEPAAQPDESQNVTAAPLADPLRRSLVYAHWPWRPPVTWLRAAFIEVIMRPLVRLLAGPRVTAPAKLQSLVTEPLLIVANHVTAYDGPLVQFALPGPMRRHMATAMSGEMLDDFRHARKPGPGPPHGRFFPFGPLAYLLVTALFNVFPLPRLRDFQRSFAHAGEALDRGFHVLIFPEGTRSARGQLASFRPGIGLLVRQANTAVLPVALRGLGQLKARGRGWFRSGTLEVRVGEPIRFAPDASEAAITARLRQEVARLLESE